MYHMWSYSFIINYQGRYTSNSSLLLRNFTYLISQIVFILLFLENKIWFFKKIKNTFCAYKLFTQLF